MKSALIPPGKGETCTEAFIEQIYQVHNPDFAKCWYNNIDAVASWKELPLKFQSTVINSTSDNSDELSQGSFYVLISLAAICILCTVVIWVSIICKERLAKRRGKNGSALSTTGNSMEMQLLTNGFI